jgi:hypothetical protein
MVGGTFVADRISTLEIKMYLSFDYVNPSDMAECRAHGWTETEATL